MVRVFEQKEINELSQLLTDCGILPVEQVGSFLKKRGKSKEQIDTILNQMVKRKLATYDDSELYLKANRAVNRMDINPGYIKSIWVLIDLMDNVGEYFVQTKVPHVLTFHNINVTEGNPFYDVFYIPYNSEKINAYIINNSIKSEEDVNAMIILDDESQISKLNFEDKINIVSYITVATDGTVLYLEGDK